MYCEIALWNPSVHLIFIPICISVLLWAIHVLFHCYKDVTQLIDYFLVDDFCIKFCLNLFSCLKLDSLCEYCSTPPLQKQKTKCSGKSILYICPHKSMNSLDMVQ